MEEEGKEQQPEHQRQKSTDIAGDQQSEKEAENGPSDEEKNQKLCSVCP